MLLYRRDGTAIQYQRHMLRPSNQDFFGKAEIKIISVYISLNNAGAYQCTRSVVVQFSFDVSSRGYGTVGSDESSKILRRHSHTEIDRASW